MKSNQRSERFSFIIGVAISACLHLLTALIAITILRISAARASKTMEFFTVTLEGGEALGGINQVPTNNKHSNKVLPAQHTEKKEAPKIAEEVKEIKSPSVIEEKKKEAEKEILKKKAEQEKIALKQKEELEKKKEQERKEKEIAEQKKNEENNRKQRIKKLQNAVASQLAKGNTPKPYEGESTDAGGKGFGAAKIGGKGIGGGTVADIEFVAYKNSMEKQIKNGWRWIQGSTHFVAKVQFKILPSGIVHDAQVIQSSSNPTFDDSALRAVFKASPLPPPPERFYEKFREVIIEFDSSDY